MGYALVHYASRFDENERLFKELENRDIEKSLIHYASRLLEEGLQKEAELEEAMHKAIAAFCSAHLSCQQHFKKVYVCRQGQLKADWLVSDLGMRMIIMHTDTTNPVMASLQVQILSEAPH